MVNVVVVVVVLLVVVVGMDEAIVIARVRHDEYSFFIGQQLFLRWSSLHTHFQLQIFVLDLVGNPKMVGKRKLDAFLF
jgi:hypothetical protein